MLLAPNFGTNESFNCYVGAGGTDGFTDDTPEDNEMSLAQCFMECAWVDECHSITVQWSENAGMVNCYIRGFTNWEECEYSEDEEYSTFDMGGFPSLSTGLCLGLGLVFIFF